MGGLVLSFSSEVPATKIESWKALHLLSHLTGPTGLRTWPRTHWTLNKHMKFLSVGLVPTHQHQSQNKTPKSNKGRRGLSTVLKKKKKDQLLIYKSSRCTEFSLKKIVIHNKYSTKKIFILQY